MKAFFVTALLLTFIVPAMQAGGTGCPGSPPRPVGSGGISDDVRIAWDYSTLQEISPIGDYPRMCRISGETVAVVYENGYGSTVIRYSGDEGQSWSTPDTLFHSFTAEQDGKSALVWISNPELIRLSTGELLAACNYRPQKQDIYPFEIVVRRSTDMGSTWTSPQTVYRAGKSFGDGCWEPSFLELPNGDVHIYFSNEGIFTESDEQDIEVLISRDKGITWEPDTRQVCFRGGKRDGMPVACLAGNEILVSVEDNKIGEFKPSIIRNPVEGCWQKPVLADSSLREYALLEPLHDTIYAGAPYIITLPSGEIALSYQTTHHRTKNWELSTMEVAVGDRKGRNFTNITRPFDIPTDRLAKWNSIAVWDDTRIAALSGCNYDGGKVGVWMILGHIIPPLTASPSRIKIDGNISAGEWGDGMPIFIGHKGPSNMRAKICRQGSNLCFAAAVNALPQNGSRINFYLDAGNAPYKITVYSTGNADAYRLEKGVWKPTNGKIGVGIKTSGSGYKMELKVPFLLVGIGSQSYVRVNCGLMACTTDNEPYEERIANTEEKNSATWCGLEIE